MADDISVLIIEDEQIWSSALAANLEDFGFTVAGIADNFVDGVTLLNKSEFDIALLDIHLQNRNSGIELGKMLHTIYKKPFIFITGSFDSHTAKEAVDVNPSAYLTKPVNPVSLFVTIQTAINNFNEQRTATGPSNADYQSFFVKQGSRYVKIDWSDVVSLSSEKKYTSVFCASDRSTHLVRSTLTNMMTYTIPPPLQHKFVQVNRAEAVQLSFVQEITGEEVKTAYKNYPVTEAYSKELKKALTLLS